MPLLTTYHISPICQRSQDRNNPSRGKSADKDTARKAPPRYAFEDTPEPTSHRMNELRKECLRRQGIMKDVWPCDVCPKAKSKIFKSEKDWRLWKGKEAFEKAFGYRYFLYMIYEKYGVFSDRPDHFPQEFEPERFIGSEGKHLRTQYFKDQKICTDCYNFFADNGEVILDKLFPLYGKRWFKWKCLM